jgi:hypothetical protein
MKFFHKFLCNIFLIAFSASPVFADDMDIPTSPTPEASVSPSPSPSPTAKAEVKKKDKHKKKHHK